MQRSILLFALANASLALPSLAAQALVNGGFVDARISAPGQVVTHTFQAQAGEGFQVRVAERVVSTLDPRIEVFDPQGVSLGARVGNTVAGVDGIAPRTGTFRVEISDGNSARTETGPYRVHLVRAPGANEGGTLPNGGVVAAGIDTGDLDSYSFTARAGQSFQLRAADTGGTALDPRLTLYDPTGAVAGQTVATTVARLEGTAAYDGVYTVAIGDGNSEPSAVGDYELRLVLAPGANAGGSLPPGGAVEDAIGLGELDTYTFRIDAGDHFLLRLADLGATALDPTIWLYDPRGCLVTVDVDTAVASLSGVAVFSGVYTVVVGDGNSQPSAIGAYRLHFLRAPGPVSSGSLSPGSIASGRIDIGDIDSYAIDLQAGQGFILRAADTGNTALDPLLSVFDPRGSLLGTAIGTRVADFTTVAVASGTYTVVVQDGNSSPAAVGDYRLQFARLPSPVGQPLFSGQVARGTVEVGTVDLYTLALRTGETVYFHAVDVDNTALDPWIRLYDPRGTLVTQGLATRVAAIGVQAVFSGAYTLVVSDGNSERSATGRYDLHYARVPHANEHGFLLDGLPATEVIELGDLDSFTFRGRAGQVVRITMADTSGGALDPAFRLVDPIGRQIAFAVATDLAIVDRLLSLDGTYTIVTSDGNSSREASGTYTLQVAGGGEVGNAGCSGEGPPQLDARPSVATGFGVAAPVFSRACSGPSVVLLGTCLPGTGTLSAPLTCGTCGVDLAAVVLSGVDGVRVPPLPPALAGFTLCAQSVCATGACLTVSATLRVTLAR